MLYIWTWEPISKIHNKNGCKMFSALNQVKSDYCRYDERMILTKEERFPLHLIFLNFQNRDNGTTISGQSCWKFLKLANFRKREAINRKFWKIWEEKHIKVPRDLLSFRKFRIMHIILLNVFGKSTLKFFVQWKAPDLLTIPEEKLHPLTCTDRNILTEGFHKRTYLQQSI